MRYSLKALTNRAKTTRRKSVTFRAIKPPGTLASDLYASTYAEVIKAWEQAIPAIMAEYERSLSALTTDSPEEIGQVLSATENEMTRVMLSLRIRLERWARKVEAFQRGKWRGAVLTATGVDISTMVGPANMRVPLGTAIERNVALVSSVSQQARTRIAEALFSGLTKRSPAREVAASIREATAMSRRRALGIASNELTNLTAELNRERATEAGLEYYEWVHSGKVHPREEHRDRNGSRFKYGEPVGDEPGMAIHCGCTSRAVLSLDDEF